uniref:Putative mrna splicing protein smn survival motor neuron n=1 Tax=Panstrongylus megistus TaxID=65343 RepID=A0A069DR79_9HEMI
MSDNVLYIRDEKMSASEDENQENIWDDSLLIKAYERAVNSTKEKVASKLNLENGDVNQESKSAQPSVNPKGKKHKKTSTSENKEAWAIGMYCRATYSEDGLEYEAVIKNISMRKGTCRVKYIGYSNEEDILISDLKPSHGPEARKIQTIQCETSKDFDQLSSYKQEKIPEQSQFREQGMIPPPPPPHVMAHFPKDESDALSAMLMSWYMSGYHTGFYQGLTVAKTNSQINGFNSHLK